jgi:hypothetical protein
MHRIFRVKAYEMEHGPHFNIDVTTEYVECNERG